MSEFHLKLPTYFQHSAPNIVFKKGIRRNTFAKGDKLEQPPRK